MSELARRALAMDGIHRIHFVGIGGAGMCGIAEVLLAEGYSVSGSDLVRSAVTERLAGLGAAVRIGHDAEAVAGAHAVVVSSAVAADNVEVARARTRGIPVLARAVMLGELMRYRRGIAIAGSHGKTTTAAMLASIFDAAGLDPTVVVGGAIGADGGNARLGVGDHIIVEADESDASFLHLPPHMAAITNVDADHLGTYRQNIEYLQQAFLDFAHRLPFSGTVAVGVDDPRLVDLAARIDRRVLRYGFDAEADFRASGMRYDCAGGCTFEALRPAAGALPVRIPLPGAYNVQNAMAAIALATAEGIADHAIVQGLADFRGVARRFEVAECVAGGKRFTLLDDYGHHPTEIGCVIDAVRHVWPGRRLVMAYQPHRPTRTRDLFDDFVAVLSRPERLILAEVYAASETPIPGADSRSLADRIRRHGQSTPLYAATPEAALELLLSVVDDDDVVAVQGAGDIDQLAAALRADS